MEFFKNLNKDEKKFFDNYVQITLLLNAILIPLSGIYELGVSNSFYGQIIGILFILTFFCNLGLVYLNDKHLDRTIERERKLNYLTYGYLIFAILTVTTLMVSSGVGVNIRRPKFDPMYYILWIFAFVISYYDFKIIITEKWNMAKNPIQTRRKENTLKILLISLILLTVMFTGLFVVNLSTTTSEASVHPFLIVLVFSFSYFLIMPLSVLPVFVVLLFKYKWKGANTTRTIIGLLKAILLAISIVVFFYTAFFAFFLLAGGNPRLPALFSLNVYLAIMIPSFMILLPIITVLLYKIVPKEHKKIIKSITYIGIFLTLSFSLPFLTTPISIIDANNQFADAFGRDWNEFHPGVEDEFLNMQQVLIQSWFGEPELDPDSWRLDSNHVYNETDEYKLKYDVYYPGPIGAQFIGEKATILFIHGGSWTSGDKTDHNPFFKYFAAQGYVVFSIDYRLIETTGSPKQSRVGDYNVEDMMEDVARFTQFITINEEDDELVHDADLDNVFIMGISAGAHLAGVAGFGYNDDIWGLDNRLEIKGVILFYPPDDDSMSRLGSKNSYYYQRGFTKYKSVEDDPDFIDSYTPSKLLDKNDPPCIIFQGSSDSLVSPINAEKIKKAGKREGVDVIVVTSYFIGHVHDLSVLHKTMMCYYMERFMYLIKED
ncbi:MAG: alpha/beta hydrolase [Promethearchaeota archaeon]